MKKIFNNTLFRWVILLITVGIVYTGITNIDHLRNLYIRAFTAKEVQEEPKRSERILLVGTQLFRGFGVTTRTEDLLSSVYTVFANLPRPHNKNMYFVWIANTKLDQYLPLGFMYDSGTGFRFSAYVDEKNIPLYDEIVISEESTEEVEIEFPKNIALFGTFAKNSN